MKHVSIGMLIMSLLGSFANAQHAKRLYIANDDHTDYMWTANEAQYDTAFLKMLDYYLDQIDSTINEAEDFQTRFNCDGSYWLKVYEKYRSPQQFSRLINRVRSGHISSPLNSLVSTYGAQPAEAVIRGMFYAGKLERKYNLRFRLAVSMENQTLPLGLSSLWAGSGARYSWKGVCGCASKIAMRSLKSRRNQLYYYRGLDSSGVLMKWYNLGQNNTFLGGYAEARAGLKPVAPVTEISSIISDLDSLCGDSFHLQAYPYKVAGAFGYGWDDLASYVSPSFIVAAKQMTNEARSVRISNELDFFEDIERTYPNLPNESVSYGNEWDTYNASMNETSAKVKRSIEKLRAAEAMAAIVSLIQKNFAINLEPLKEKAWTGLGQYWEHDWTADGPVPQKDRAEWQIKVQKHIADYVDTLYENALTTLASLIQKGNNPRFFVFNPLSWIRNDIVDIPFSSRYSFRVIDLSTGNTMRSQVIWKDKKTYIRIRAENIPSVGYKVFEIQNAKQVDRPPAATLKGEYFSNDKYRIRISRSGVITEIYDRITGKQLVKKVDGKYVNDLGSSDINDGDSLVIENQGPVSVTVKAVSKNPLRHSVRVTLYFESDRIEIENKIEENFTDLKTWAFSFNLKDPITRHEEIGAILTAKKDNRGGHYASQNARYDWLTFNHFADMSESEYGITLSNLDCSFFKLGNSTADILIENATQINALAGGQTDGDRLGIRAQHGASEFNYHFALITHAKAFDATMAMKFSMEHQNPFIAGMVNGSKFTSQKKSYSLLTISNPEVLLWSVKSSEEGIANGIITRFWNMKGAAVQAKLNIAREILAAKKVSHIETDEETIESYDNFLKLDLRPHQISSYRLYLKQVK